LIVSDDDSGASAIDEAASAFGLLVRRASGGMAIEAALRDYGPGIVQLARELGIGTAAEAVETQQTLDFLHAAGCDRIQGFLVSRPLPASEFQAVAERWR
jgi:hypothetical protein